VRLRAKSGEFHWREIAIHQEEKFMNSGIRKVIFSIIVAATLVLSIGWRAAAWNPHNEHEIVGTWLVTVQLNNCSGTTLGSPFASLLTFADGETMIEDTTNPSFAVGQRGTGHGIWELQGHHSYLAKSIAFINFTTTPPPPPGFTAGTQTIMQTIEFNNGPDQWTADAQIAFADATGAIYRQACATATAKRFE
jgi:hypothetical protein